MRTTARRVISSLLALTLLSTAGLSQVVGPRPAARVVVPASVRSQDRALAAQREPIELSVREDVRERCRAFQLPPEPYVIQSPPGSDADALALEGLIGCLTHAPLDGQELELMGPTELPGSRQHATEAAAAADAVRALFSRLGISFERMVTRDVPFDASTSSHAAPRVVVGLSVRDED